MMKKCSSLLPLLFVLILLGACAKKPVPPAPQPPSSEPIADLREFPQNLEVYAKEAGKDKRLLSAEAQSSMNTAFNNIYFGPWEMRRTTVTKRDATSVFGRARGYKQNSIPWTQPEWDAIRANANLGSFPSRASQAITLRQTDLREIPTHEPRFVKSTPEPSKDPFDYFQYSLLPAAMPLLIVHTSADGKWHYVECPIAGGWVDARDVATVDEKFKSDWLTGRYAALVADRVRLPGTGLDGKDSTAGIGAILPVARDGVGGALNVLVPVLEKNGSAGTAEIALASSDAKIKPVPLTPGNVAAVGNVMMGQPYGWGGTLGNRDCSAMIRDLFTPFGIWLPRNSAAQAKRGHLVRLAGMNAQQKAQTIMSDGQPFLSLVGMPGHITLYIGPWHNRPALFHNAWGVRIVKDGDDNERQVIGRAVVTSITPGIELQNLYRPRTFVDRINSLANLGAK